MLKTEVSSLQCMCGRLGPWWQVQREQGKRLTGTRCSHWQLQWTRQNRGRAANWQHQAGKWQVLTPRGTASVWPETSPLPESGRWAEPLPRTELQPRTQWSGRAGRAKRSSGAFHSNLYYRQWLQAPQQHRSHKDTVESSGSDLWLYGQIFSQVNNGGRTGEWPQSWRMKMPVSWEKGATKTDLNLVVKETPGKPWRRCRWRVWTMTWQFWYICKILPLLQTLSFEPCWETLQTLKYCCLSPKVNSTLQLTKWCSWHFPLAAVPLL